MQERGIQVVSVSHVFSPSHYHPMTMAQPRREEVACLFVTQKATR